MHAHAHTHARAQLHDSPGGFPNRCSSLSPFLPLARKSIPEDPGVGFLPSSVLPWLVRVILLFSLDFL